MFSQLLRSLEIPLEDGLRPWPPDGQAPAAEGTASTRGGAPCSTTC
jgi:hypothetical protein